MLIGKTGWSQMAFHFSHKWLKEFHYVEPRHKSEFLDSLWEIGQAIRNCKMIEFDYA